MYRWHIGLYIVDNDWKTFTVQIVQIFVAKRSSEFSNIMDVKNVFLLLQMGTPFKIYPNLIGSVPSVTNDTTDDFTSPINVSKSSQHNSVINDTFDTFSLYSWPL